MYLKLYHHCYKGSSVLLKVGGPLAEDVDKVSRYGVLCSVFWDQKFLDKTPSVYEGIFSCTDNGWECLCG